MSDQEITTNASNNLDWQNIPNYLDPSKLVAQSGPPIEWNPTTPDVADPDNEYVAQKILGLVPCEGWHYVNFGSAGGAALMNDGRCTHDNGTKCYPSMTTGNMHGKIGGCPDYKGNWNSCKALLDHLRQDGKTVMLTFDGYGDSDGAVVAVIRDIDCRTSITDYAGTMQEALVKAAIKFHKYRLSRDAKAPTFLQEYPIPVETVKVEEHPCPQCGNPCTCAPGALCGQCACWSEDSSIGK